MNCNPQHGVRQTNDGMTQRRSRASRLAVRSLLSLMSLSLSFAGLSGCAGDLDSLDASLTTLGQGIVGGAPESGYEAVGALISDGEPFCTGTLVSSDIFVTAAHCLEDGTPASQISVYFGRDANRPSSGTVVQAESLVMHPNYDGEEIVNDIAIIRLASSPDITPIPIRTAPMDSADIGQDGVFVGFGVRSATSEEAGEKYSVKVPITEVDPTTFTYAAASRNTCFGDSGGPALSSDGSRLIGVTSHGDDNCTEFGVNTRVDAFQTWIQSYYDGGGDVSNPGGGSSGGGTSGDICEDEGWYGDDICDEDCARPDPDCGGGGTPGGGASGDDICEQEGWYGDDICDEDCARPDPDCGGGGDPSGGSPSDGDICEQEGWYDDGAATRTARGLTPTAVATTTRARRVIPSTSVVRKPVRPPGRAGPCWHSRWRLSCADAARPKSNTDWLAAKAACL